MGPEGKNGMEKFRIGQLVRRQEDVHLLRGTGQFVDDLSPPGMLRGHDALARIGAVYLSMVSTPQKV